VAEWISTDGLNWSRLTPSGEIATKPAWTDGPSADDAFLLPGGVAWIGRDTDGAPLLWWSTPVP
jgi:hypothetical protein